MKLPLSIAQKLLQLQKGNTIPAAQMRHKVVDKMLEDGILHKQRIGSNRNLYFIDQQADLDAYLSNHFGIADLAAYTVGYAKIDLTRGEAVDISSDSKLKSIRTFKGFLANCFEPIQTALNGSSFVVEPTKGSFQFIYDFEHFIPATDVIIVGVENPENFSKVAQQQYLFEGKKTLFISRYPQSQSGDVMKWLQRIPNQYLHFGDFDFEGINIYVREYKSYLKARAKFFVPQGIESLVSTKGNRNLYNHQLHHQPNLVNTDQPELLELVALFHKYKKVLEQEALIGS